MEFKFPRKIIVGDIVFKMKYDKKMDGAEFKYPEGKTPGLVTIGMRDFEGNPLTFLNYVMHEFKEIIQIEHGARLFNRTTDSYEFHYTHKEHTDVCSRLAGILNQFIK